MKRQDEYAAELGRRVIAALAPQELPLVTVFARWARYGLGRSVSRRSLNRREVWAAEGAHSLSTSVPPGPLVPEWTVWRAGPRRGC